MYKNFIDFLLFFKNYILINFSGIFRIYKNIFFLIFKRLTPFTIKDFIHYLIILCATALTGAGWRSYDVVINDEIIHHSISSNDFLFFLISFFMMMIPAILKFFGILLNAKLHALISGSGLFLATIFYVLNLIFPGRTLLTPEATFTIWFYLFGFNLIILWIIEVLSILSMPSTHSRN